MISRKIGKSMSERDRSSRLIVHFKQNESLNYFEIFFFRIDIFTLISFCSARRNLFRVLFLAKIYDIP